jgi:hypothetical protein
MKRTLVLDENDLIMVVKNDVVEQIDANRGELTRTEFVNYLIQCQLREHENKGSYVSLAEFKEFSRQMSELVYNFLQFFISYGMTIGPARQDLDLQQLGARLEALARYHREED